MTADDTAPVWRALADPTRRRMLDLLRDGPRTTGELDAAFEVSRFAVMKHLNVLEEAGLVRVRRRGRQRWNHLDPVPIQRVYERWIRPYQAHWASSLLALQRQVEHRPQEEETMDGLGSMHVETEITIAGTPAAVWRALTVDTASWWGAPYQRGEAIDIVLDARLGGRLEERWADGDGAVWGTVTALRREAHLELEGPIGMAGPVASVVRIDLEPHEDTTVVRLSHEAVGRVDDDTRRSYAAGWEDLLGVRLKALVEDGTRYGVGHPAPASASDAS